MCLLVLCLCLGFSCSKRFGVFGLGTFGFHLRFAGSLDSELYFFPSFIFYSFLLLALVLQFVSHRRCTNTRESLCSMCCVSRNTYVEYFSEVRVTFIIAPLSHLPAWRSVCCGSLFTFLRLATNTTAKRPPKPSLHQRPTICHSIYTLLTYYVPRKITYSICHQYPDKSIASPRIPLLAILRSHEWLFAIPNRTTPKNHYPRLDAPSRTIWHKFIKKQPKYSKFTGTLHVRTQPKVACWNHVSKEGFCRIPKRRQQ